MGILNVTPDSFHVASRQDSLIALVDRAGKMIADGADILDIGGQSTRPGASRISAQEESERVLPAIEAVFKAFPEAIISVDTFYGQVAESAVKAGASIINDVSGGQIDPGIFEVAGRLHVPYVLTHIHGEPQAIQNNLFYENVTADVVKYFSEKIAEVRKSGVHDIILDPGFGFGKNMEHNLQLLRDLDQLSMFGLPILAGLSRKRTIQQLLDVDAAGALNGTVVAHTIAMMHGAGIIRVHDVKEAKQSAIMVDALFRK
jgi:dihydropteroate synthase